MWLREGDIAKALQAISKIEKEAHSDGLTDRISEFLGKENEKVLEKDVKKEIEETEKKK